MSHSEELIKCVCDAMEAATSHVFDSEDELSYATEGWRGEAIAAIDAVIAFPRDESPCSNCTALREELEQAREALLILQQRITGQIDLTTSNLPGETSRALMSTHEQASAK